MNRGVSITFKEKIAQDLPDDIKALAKKYEDIGIFSINIPKQTKQELDQVILVDMQWVELLLKGKTIHQRYLKEVINMLSTWIDRWKAAENASAGSNRNLIEELTRIIRDVRTKLLAVMIWRRPKVAKEVDLNDHNTIKPAADKIQAFANTLYEASSSPKNFEMMVLHGKRDYFRTNCWPPGSNSVTLNEFFDLFKDDFDLFLEKGINEIYKKEIIKQLNLQNNVTFMDLDRIYNYFLGSYVSFIKFLNRNYQYSLIEDGLMEQGLPYDRLQTSINTSLKPLIMTITSCPFPQLREKQFELGNFGLESSPRFCSDKLVIFGKDAHEEFTTDICLPNARGIDSIFAFIYINNQGHYLVDISKRASIRIKLTPKTPIRLVSGMIIIFAKMHAYEVTISDPVNIGGKNITNLTLNPAQGCTVTQSTGHRNISPDGNKLVIGRNPECNLSLQHGDISHVHAECYFDGDTSEWMLVDLGSQNGTFYKLKSLTQCVNLSPSDAFKLEKGVLFSVENFTFFISEVEY